MKIVLVILLLIAIVVLYYGTSMYVKYQASKTLIAQAKAFQLPGGDTTTTLLVLGDSTAVGVGATKPEDTLAALIAQKTNATYVENRGVSGARVEDLEAQIASTTLPRYSRVLVQIGANDIVRFKNADDAARTLDQALEKLPQTDSLIVLSAGNVGGTRFFPWFVNYFYTKLNLTYHDRFAKVVGEHGGTYINLYEDPKTDPYVQQPEIYLAKDGFHPTSAGYALWFKKIVEKAGL